MKLDYFMLFIALLIGGLIFYGFYSIEEDLAVSAIGAILCDLFLLLALSIGIPEYPRSTTMFRVLSGCIFVLLLVIDLLFLKLELPAPTFFITNGLIAAGGAIGLNFIYKSKQ